MYVVAGRRSVSAFFAMFSGRSFSLQDARTAVPSLGSCVERRRKHKDP